MFNRTPDVAGLTFFVNALNNGTQNINTIAINILDGAQGSDLTTVNNKIAAADLYTKALDTGAEIVAYSGNAAAAQGRAFLAPITTTVPNQAAVDAAVKTMVDASTAGGTGTDGVTIALAAATDAISPNSSESKFKSTAGNDTIIGGTVLASTNVIDAGNGTDTLTATLADSTTAIKPVLKSVENVNLTLNAAAVNGAAFDAGASTGIQKLALAGTFADSKTAALSGVEKTTAVSLADLNTATGKAGVVTVAYQNATGSTDAASISLSKVGTDTTNNGTVKVAAGGIENLTVDTAATSKVILDVTDAVTLKFTGAGDLSVTEAGTLAKLASIDASSMTGALNLTLSGDHIAGFKIATGLAADKVDLTLSTTTDTLVYSVAAQSTIAKVDSITGFTFDGAGSDKIDVKAFNLGAATTVALTTLDSTGSDVPSMFTGTNKIVFNDTSDTLYIDLNGDGNFNATTDLAVKFVGGVDGTKVDISDFIIA